MKNFKKVTATIAAAVLCAVPMMMNTISANAYYVSVTGGYIPGDANQDGYTNDKDATLVANYSKGIDPEPAKRHEINLATADVNGDGVITYVDSKIIKKYVDNDMGNYNRSRTARERFKKEVGDINLDGKLSMVDVLVLDDYIRKGGINKASNMDLFTRADVNGDRSITNADVTAIQRRILQLPWTE